VSARKLDVCEGCFDGRKTWWMDLAGRYFDDHAAHCKATKEVRRDHEK
jgi:hypothetical protein